MRITLVTETYFPQVNGVSRTLGQLVRHLIEAGDTVQLIHPDYGETRQSEHDLLVWSKVLLFYKEVVVPIPPFGHVHRAIKMFAPDIVHIATEATLGLSALRYVRKRQIPVVSSFHTNFDQYTRHYRLGFTNGTVWKYLRWFHNRTAETYVPSNATISELAARGFERLVLWQRGVHADVFRPDRPGRETLRTQYSFQPDNVVIGHVSRLAPEKNVGLLGDALRQVVSQRPNVKILFVGDGPSRPSLEKALGKIAVFAGYRSGDDLADHYSACDLFAFASLTETFGNVVLEAMSSGLPVVAVRAGGVGDTVQDDKTGLLVEPTDPASKLAEALITLVDDQVRRNRLSKNAREYALEQSWDAIMSNLRQRYRSVLGLV